MMLKTIADKLDVFFHSSTYMIVLTVIAFLGLYLRLEVLTIFVIGFFVILSWLTSEDILPSFLMVALIGMIALRIPRGDELAYFRPLYFTPIFIVPAFVAKLFIHPFRLEKGLFFYPTVAVAIAITIGGLFSISLERYFSLPTIYYTVGLGIGMVGIYFILERYLLDRDDIVDYFSKMMVAIGAVGTFMLFAAYYEMFGSFFSIQPGSHFQWRNNLSNNLLMSMPFAFYLATKGRFSIFYFILGSLQYLALVFSFSRGGILFGNIIYPLVVIAAITLAKGERIRLLTAFVLFIGITYAVFENWIIPVADVYSAVVNRLTISTQEARANLYRMAWSNFKAYPIFGTGLGFDTSAHYNPKTMSMYWYHSTVFQVIGSLGIVGIIAYFYQELVRLKVLVVGDLGFNLFVFIAMIGFSGYSLVNVGYFVPIPFVAMFLTMFMVVERNNKHITA